FLPPAEQGRVDRCAVDPVQQRLPQAQVVKRRTVERQIHMFIDQPLFVNGRELSGAGFLQALFKGDGLIQRQSAFTRNIIDIPRQQIGGKGGEVFNGAERNPRKGGFAPLP